MRGLLLVFTLAGGPRERTGDRWLSEDKARHFFTSAFVQSFGYGALRATGAGHGASLAGASAVTAAAGLGKELRDRGGRGTPSVKDLAWDAAGAGAATVMLVRVRQ